MSITTATSEVLLSENFAIFFVVRMFSHTASSSSSNVSRFKPLGSDETDVGGVVGVGGLTEAFTPEMREKMVRLEKENQILRRRVESAESAPQDAGIVLLERGCPFFMTTITVCIS